MGRSQRCVNAVTRPTMPRASRILAVGPLPPPLGGDTVSFRRIVESEVWGASDLQLLVVDTASKGAIRVDGTPSLLSNVRRALSILVRYLWNLPRARTVLLCCNSPFLWTIGLVLIRLGRLAGREVWVKPFGGSWDERLDELGAKRRERIRRTLSEVHGFLPQTKGFAAYLREKVLDDGVRIELLPNFITRTAPPSFDGEAHGSGRFVYVGQIKEEKGVFDLLESLSGLPQVRCEFWGPVLPRDRERFDAAIGRADNASYGGQLEPDGVSSKIADCVALVLPTFHEGEGVPGVILEAFSVGRPVVTTRWKELPEIVEDGRNGYLVDPQSPTQLARAIERLHGDREEWLRLARGAFASAEPFREQHVLGRILIGALAGVRREPAGPR